MQDENRPGRPTGEDASLLASRLALRPREAARVLGVSERTLRSLLPELPTVRRGNTVLIPVELLREWLRKQAEASKSRVDADVDEILAAFEGNA